MPPTPLTHLRFEAAILVLGKEPFRSFDRHDRSCLILPCSITNVNEVDKYITHRHLTRFLERKNGMSLFYHHYSRKHGAFPCFVPEHTLGVACWQAGTRRSPPSSIRRKNEPSGSRLCKRSRTWYTETLSRSATTIQIYTYPVRYPQYPPLSTTPALIGNKSGA